MKNLKIAALALMGLATTLPALAQTKPMTSQPPMMKQGGMKGGMMSDKMAMKRMTMGLSMGEKKTAMMHMKKMSAAEKAAHMKMYKMMAMGMSMDAAMMKMSAAEQATLKGMMAKMTPAEKAVGMKMMRMAAKPRPMAMKRG